MPLILDSKIVYFSGFGTDALGYIRVAKSIIEEWYFKPILSLNNLRSIIFHPAREWVYAMISANDRPGAYLFVAINSFLCGLNVFQGYLISCSLILVLIFHYLGFLTTIINKTIHTKWFLIALSALLIFSFGISGNFYNQFFGHILGIFNVIVLTPLAAIVIRNLDFKYKNLIFCTFISTFISTLYYDIRIALFGFIPLTVTFIIFHTRKSKNFLRTTISISFYCIVGALISFIISGFRRDVLSLAPNLFTRIKFSLASFTESSALGDYRYLSIIFIFILILILTSITSNYKKILKIFSYPAYFTFPLIYNFILLLLTLTTIGLLLKIKNDWAAMKLLYVLLPAAIIQIILYVSFLFEKNISLFSKRIGQILFILLTIMIFFSAKLNIVKSQKITNRHLGLIRTDGILKMLDDIKLLKFDKIYILSNNPLRYLILITLLDDINVPKQSLYNMWYTGGGVRRQKSGNANFIYKKLSNLPEWRSQKNILLISDLGRNSSQVSYGIVNGIEEFNENK